MRKSSLEKQQYLIDSSRSLLLLTVYHCYEKSYKLLIFLNAYYLSVRSEYKSLKTSFVIRLIKTYFLKDTNDRWKYSPCFSVIV